MIKTESILSYQTDKKTEGKVISIFSELVTASFQERTIL